MRHLRADYDAVQPFPVRRPHIAKIDGETVDAGRESPDHIRSLGKHMEPLIPDDEPVFLLRGQDPAAAPAVRAWADTAEQLGADSEMVAAARLWASEMEQWADQVRHGPPDTPAGLLRGPDRAGDQS